MTDVEFTLSEFTLTDFRHLLRRVAGDSDGLDGDISDADLSDLGYDSLALLEAASAIERERGVRLDEAALAEVRTPRDFLGLVNSRPADAGEA